ncbi:5-carboxymethyl-2-hydroxymuconate Delta-isomerase [Haliea sp. AH-315-K21]|uniref:5-carboxymethyl-2-hydroxymuconate delta-isomerase n=1 Tax=SAR86 cluster bacterium TaxID=2030880 RepID=A0A2A5C6A4_9GAMM|nr:5-carboxymethyl-2-hydroxymuconate Delta-isomerase [Haliea sp. AH-315-K21]PCJ39404.1 MAG: 5-carboxymethyl-2-hydroxymuconate delta-isomerase [SAR86 cluster bacterium]
MAHFIIEYSDNLGQDKDSIQSLLSALHQAADDTKLFPLKGIRSRAYCCEQYRMADGNPQHGFAHLQVLLGVGRTLDEKQKAADLFFEVFTNHFSAHYDERGMALSFEMKELEAVLKFNKNNIQDHL